LDISKEPLEISCPSCNRKITVTFKDAMNKKLVKCSGCGQEIQLSPDSKLKKGLKDFNDTVKNVEKGIEKLHKKLK